MSEEPSSGLSLKKKLKFAVAKSNSFKMGSSGRKDFDRSSRDSGTISGPAAARKGKLRSETVNVKRQRVYGGRDSDTTVVKHEDGVRSSKVSFERRKTRGMKDENVEFESDEKSARDGKFRSATHNVKRQRVYGGRDGDTTVMPFTDGATHGTKSVSRRRQDTKIVGKGSESSSTSVTDSKRLRHSSSQDKYSFKKREDGVRRSKVSFERRKIRGEKDENVEFVRKTRFKNSKDSSKIFSSTEKKSRGVAPPLDHAKKRGYKKSNTDGDPESLVDRPIRSKRVIRIDPSDLSNKRLDDRVITHENVRQEKASSEKKDEMSRNAQFRAIQPSESILSYVEDNLLGRRRMIEIKRAGYNTELSAPLDNIPLSTSPERERIEETVFRNKLTFYASAKVSSSFPPPDMPEIAFAGRSNVGKSSLLNALTRQWGVARTSDKPGLTQTINFFDLGSKLSLVDLPGYGFAYAKEEVKDSWEELVKEYVATRVGLKRVCLLVDAKWGLKPRDQELINLMERSQTKYQIVLTKTDMIFPMDVARRVTQIEETFKGNKSIVQPMMMVSSKSGAGIRSLRTVLAKLARFAKV